MKMARFKSGMTNRKVSALFGALLRFGFYKIIVVITSIIYSTHVFAASSEMTPVIGHSCYTYGDNETPRVGKIGALEMAKKNAVENYGVLVETETQVENFQVKRSSIITKSVGFLRQLEIVKTTENGRTICVVIKAMLDGERMDQLIISASGVDGQWVNIKNQDDCKVWNRSPKKNETVSWTGPCVAGKANGNGTLTWNNQVEGKLRGQKYEGQLRRGIISGHGVWTWANGTRYEGNGKTQGSGVFISASGSKYVGEFKNGMRHGKGVITKPSGDKYDGNWKDGKRHGHGVYVWSNGAHYEGEWKDDKRSGRGVMNYLEGTKYDGDWRGDKRDGRGIYTQNGAVLYEGEWKNGVQHGRGVFVDTDGSRYEGAWRGGLHDGYGVMVWADGSKYDGEWRDGKYHGRGKKVFPTGNFYDGEHRGGKPHGHGLYEGSNGERYEGNWKNSKRDGRGTYGDTEGRECEGKWQDNKFLGQGRGWMASEGRWMKCYLEGGMVKYTN